MARHHRQPRGMENRKNTPVLSETSVSEVELSTAAWSPERERVFNTPWLSVVPGLHIKKQD